MKYEKMIECPYDDKQSIPIYYIRIEKIEDLLNKYSLGKEERHSYVRKHLSSTITFLAAIMINCSIE